MSWAACRYRKMFEIFSSDIFFNDPNSLFTFFYMRDLTIISHIEIGLFITASTDSSMYLVIHCSLGIEIFVCLILIFLKNFHLSNFFLFFLVLAILGIKLLNVIMPKTT
jgi:hypothetical protein